MSNGNYTIGRGEVYFSRFKEDTQTPSGFLYIGNTPEFSLSIESETLDHYSSDRGIREKDASVPLEISRTGTLITDNISPHNLSLFFFGEPDTLTQSAVAASTETLSGIREGHAYPLGQSTNNITGFSGVDPSGFTVKIGSVSLVEKVDYIMDFDTGFLAFVKGSKKAVTGANVAVTYSVKASNRDRILSGTKPVEGAMRYRSANPEGKDFDYYLPYVKITPNGDYALKGDEWQQIPFNVEVLKLANAEAIYVDGRPAY